MDRTQTVCLNGVYSDAFVLRYLSVWCHTMPCHMWFMLMIQSFISQLTQLHLLNSLDYWHGHVDIKSWMLQNKLQLNDDKAELLLTGPKKFLNHPSLPRSLSIFLSPSLCAVRVPFSIRVWPHRQIFQVWRTACLEHRRISIICHYLTIDATKTLIFTFVLSRIDFCNFRLAKTPKCLLDILDKDQEECCSLHQLTI